MRNNAKSLKWLGAAGLLLMMCALGWFMIPAHVTSIWMDSEFTDWITPIANRLHGGARLYGEGMHSPMPPIPYVLMRVLHPEGAIWIQESFLNYAFETASVLLLFFAFARYVGPGLSFAACMATVPVFLTFGKTILYDSMSHFLAALCAVLCALLVESFKPIDDHPNARSKWLLPSLAGVTLGLLMLTKQSTGMGTFLGICLTLAFLPAKLSFKQRCVNIVIFGIAMTVTMSVTSLAMSRYVDIPGMVHDVFLAGTEPKGGPTRIRNNLLRYALAISQLIAMAIVLFYIVSFLSRRKIGWRARAKDLETGLNCPIGAKAMSISAQGRTMLVIMLTGAACAFAIYWLPLQSGAAVVLNSAVTAQIKLGLLNLGLVACLALDAAVFIQGLRGKPGELSGHPLAPFAIICFTTAVFHNLSITVFRWVSDSNALIALALVFLLSPLLSGFKTGEIRQPKWAVTGMFLGIICVAIMWSGFFNQFKFVQACIVPWPEIPHLAGSRLRPESDGMRQLVKLVQSQADKSAHDTVLLLPDDPNVETWFDRDRPTLSSTIIFTDQYWDRYVDPDFESLRTHPPKVIIIGPRNFWRHFSKIWHWHKDEGLIRLVDRVKNELLSEKYDLRYEHRITFGPGEDFMDVYVRRGP